jgi:hypothetical protein
MLHSNTGGDIGFSLLKFPLFSVQENAMKMLKLFVRPLQSTRFPNYPTI